MYIWLEMDIEHFLIRTNRSKADLCRELGLDPKSSVITHYVKGRATPPYDKIVELVKLGMTLEELFDADVLEILKKNSLLGVSVSELSDEDCRQIVERGYNLWKKEGQQNSENH